jgi:hypothetical protein
MTSAAFKKAKKAGLLDEFLRAKHRAHGFHLGNESRESARRGGAKVAGLYLIEKQYFTADQLAARMRTEKAKAVARYSRAKRKPGPITWAKLGVTD